MTSDRSFDQQVRPSPIAGSWYPHDPKRLKRSIEGYLTDGPPLDNVVGAMVPHAGHVYSGATAGKAFSLIRAARPRMIVIFSPHHAITSKAITTTAYAYYATPLGKIPVTHGLLAEFNANLQKNKLSELYYAHRDQEHAIEIQLPFLQTIYNHPFTLLPLMLRDMSLNELEMVVETLYPLIKDKDAMIISSSDLSHFYTQDVATQLDGYLIDAIQTYEIDPVLKAISEHGSEACGITGILAMMMLTKKLGGKRLNIIDRSTSADVSGDRTSVVGYASAVVTS